VFWTQHAEDEVRPEKSRWRTLVIGRPSYLRSVKAKLPQSGAPGTACQPFESKHHGS